MLHRNLKLAGLVLIVTLAGISLVKAAIPTNIRRMGTRALLGALTRSDFSQMTSEQLADLTDVLQERAESLQTRDPNRLLDSVEDMLSRVEAALQSQQDVEPDQDNQDAEYSNLDEQLTEEQPIVAAPTAAEINDDLNYLLREDSADVAANMYLESVSTGNVDPDLVDYIHLKASRLKEHRQHFLEIIDMINRSFLTPEGEMVFNIDPEQTRVNFHSEIPQENNGDGITSARLQEADLLFTALIGGVHYYVTTPYQSALTVKGKDLFLRTFGIRNPIQYRIQSQVQQSIPALTV